MSVPEGDFLDFDMEELTGEKNSLDMNGTNITGNHNTNHSEWSGNHSTNHSEWPEYYYNYDYDPSLSAIPLAEIIPVSMVYGLTLVVGVLGNTLVIVSILKNKRMQSVTNIFLTSLASADLLLVLLCVPIKFAKFMTFTWTFGEVLCKLVHYLQNVSVICSILLMTAMAMERYYAIVFPMKAKFLCTKRRARNISIVVWFFSFLLASPICIGQVHKPVGVRRPAYWCVKEWELPLYSRLYETGMLVLLFLLPLVIIVFAYTSICCVLYKSSMTSMQTRVSKDGAKSGKLTACAVTKSQDNSKARHQVIKILVTVVCLFMICWGPTLIDNMISAWVPEYVDPYNYGHLKYMRQAFALMAYSNSCINPIVYAFMSKNFRQSFKQTLSFRCPRRGRLSRDMSFTQYSRGTRNTNPVRYDQYRDQTQLTAHRKLLESSSCEPKEFHSESGV